MPTRRPPPGAGFIIGGFIVRLKIFALAALAIVLAVAAVWADQGRGLAFDADNPGASFAKVALIIAGILCVIIIVVIIIVIIVLLTKKKPSARAEPSEPARPSEPSKPEGPSESERPSEPKEPGGES
jgi:hypothetical protein